MEALLHYYEKNYIESLIKSNKSETALLIANMFRYQDDMIIFNDSNHFQEHWKEIYPQEMVLEKTNCGNSCTFLDLEINFELNTIKYKSFDKRKQFNFNVINYPDLHGNIPRNPAYGVFMSQLARFCDVNNERENFFADVKLLAQKLIKQKFNSVVLKAKFRKFYANNICRWSKFGSDIMGASELII